MAEKLAGDVGKLVIQNTSKRDALTEVERRCQKRWRDERVFEVDPPAYQPGVSGAEARRRDDKFFGTMAYPYMNGSLHLGHAFTLSKVEFATGFARMQGKRALFPLGFHCTGMPIKACADKLKREIEMFGETFTVPADLAAEASDSAQPAEVAQQTGEHDPTKFKSGKSKVKAKSAGLQYQFQIMRLLNIPDSEIVKFADEMHWLKYFPPLCQEDCSSLGARVDWRRSMITTDANPYYDAFVRWSMNKLHDMQKIKFGERYTVFSPKDNQPCMDHDRASGEGKGPTDYTGIKLEAVTFSDDAQAIIDKLALPADRKVFFIAATLRPETMYGQTNCFVGPKVNYGLFQAKDGEVFICTPKSARNMAYQGIFESRGEVIQLAEIPGRALVGTIVNAPLSVYGQVRILPMDSVVATKGTGVVTSVPSDSPDDFMTTQDLAKKAAFYGIDASWASNKAVPIISTPTFGDLTAPKICEMLKIQSPKDADALAKAKEMAYKEGFYAGTMLLGKYKGEKVEKAKPLVRQDLITEGSAFIYNEPEDVIMSRSGEECVIALCDQWYIDYGEPAWKAKTEECLSRMNTFGEESRNAFEQCLNWLNQWACSRTYGLGTRLPWDPQYLVESLSDSTIYMSYYTIAHWLHSSIDGSTVGLGNIRPEQMTDDIWEYVLAKGKKPANTTIPIETLDKMRYEFEYFYPLDVRVSGKDLITNHLTFWLYTHTAVFGEENWPQGVRANGLLLLNNEKMSKSTGNFLTLKEAVSKFGADATRLTLADAGDSLDDANFAEETANAMILRLFTLKEWSDSVVADKQSLRTGEFNYYDSCFENEMNGIVRQAYAAYEGASYRAAIKVGFFDFQIARDWYRDITTMHRDLILRWIEWQALLIAPFAPHFAEYIWSDVLHRAGSVQTALFPKPSRDNDKQLESGLAYIRSLASRINSSEGLQLKKKSKGKAQAYDPKKPKSLTIFFSSQFPAWQTPLVELARISFDSSRNAFDDKKIVAGIKDLPKRKDAMPFIQKLKVSVLARPPGVEASEVFDRAQLFDEEQLLKLLLPHIQSSLNNLQQVCLVKVVRSNDVERIALDVVHGQPSFNTALDSAPPMVENAAPGQPEFFFENVAA
ncbi:cytosolic leucyl tRNA synthetase [Savitreella phatthalungensis]